MRSPNSTNQVSHVESGDSSIPDSELAEDALPSEERCPLGERGTRAPSLESPLFDPQAEKGRLEARYRNLLLKDSQMQLLDANHACALAPELIEWLGVSENPTASLLNAGAISA
jgi:hypothetical protein